MQPDRSMVAQRGASAPTEEGEREGPLGPEPAAPSAVLNDPMQLMQMMQQMVTASMAPMMAKVTEVADRQDAFERRASMPPADVDAGEVSAGRRAQRLDGLHGADNLSANAPGPEQSGDTPVLAYGTGARISPSQEGSPPAHVPSGSAGGDHDGPDGPLSQCLESTGGLAAPADSVASSLAPHGQAATMVLDRPPTRSGAKTKTAAIENTQEEDTMGASGLLRSSSGESLSALERSVCRHLPVARTLQRGPNPTATSGGRKSPREVFAGAPPEKGNKAPGAPAPSPAPEPEPEPAPDQPVTDPLSIAPLNGTEGPYNENDDTSDHRVRPLHEHLILPGHSDPSPAPDVGGGSVGSAATVLDGVSSPGQAVDAGQPLPSGGAATSSTTISGDEELSEFFTTAAHGFHHVDDVAERRVVAERGDFLSSEMAARFGPEKPIVRFTDECAEAMMPRDYQRGYRAGQKAKFCLCINPAEDCTKCGKYFKKSNDAVIAARNADRAVAGDYADEGDPDQSGGTAAMDGSDITVGLSAIADVLTGALSPAENSLAEEAAGLRDGNLEQDSFITTGDDSGLSRGGGGDDSSWNKSIDFGSPSSFSVYADLSSAPPITHLEQLRAALVVSLNTAASMVRGHGSLQESGGGFMGFAINGDRDLSARIGELVTDLHERPGDGATLDAWEEYAKAQREKVHRSGLQPDWRKTENGDSELVLRLSKGGELNSSEVVSEAHALLVKALADNVETKARGAELQQELHDLKRTVNLTQTSLLRYMPKVTEAEQQRSSLATFAAGLGTEANELAARVGELRGENDSLRSENDSQKAQAAEWSRDYAAARELTAGTLVEQDEAIAVLTQDKVRFADLSSKLQEAVEEQSVELAEAAATRKAAVDAEKQVAGQLRKAVADNAKQKAANVTAMAANADAIRALDTANEMKLKYKDRLAASKKAAAEAAVKLSAERATSLDKANAQLDEITALKSDSQIREQKLTKQGERNRELADERRAATAAAAAKDAEVSALKLTLAAKDAAIDELRVATAAAAGGSPDGDDGPSEGSDDEPDGGGAGKGVGPDPDKALERSKARVNEDRDIVMHVHVFTSGSPVHAHALPHVLHHLDTRAETPQIMQSGPKYSVARTMPLEEITSLARRSTIDMATMFGVDPLVVEMAFETEAQWETTAAARADSGTGIYDVFCCIGPDVMDELVASEHEGERVFGRVAVTDDGQIMSVGDDDDPADMELTRALDSWIDPVSAAIVMEAHTARLAFFGNHTAWPIDWADVDDPSFSARRCARSMRLKYNDSVSCVALRFGMDDEDVRLERNEAELRGAGSPVFAAVTAAATVTSHEVEVHEAVKRAATPAGMSFTESPILKRPELGGAVEASTVGEGVESVAKPRAVIEAPLTKKLDAAEETIDEIEDSVTDERTTVERPPGSFDWLVAKLGGGTAAVQARTFGRLDGHAKLDIMIQVDFLRNEMCFKTITAAMRKTGIRVCLKKVWAARLEATGILATLEKLEAAGEPIVRLEQIWSLENPPERFLNGVSAKKKVLRLDADDEAGRLLALILKCADKRSVGLIAKELEIKEVVREVIDESGGDTSTENVRIATKLAKMGVGLDTIEGITAIDAAEDGTMDSSISEAAAQLIHADSRDDDDSGSVASRSSSGHSSDGHHGSREHGRWDKFDRTHGSAAPHRLSKTNEYKLQEMYKRARGSSVAEQVEMATKALKKLKSAALQGGVWTLTASMNSPALMAAFARQMRDSQILGVEHPDTGVTVAVETVGPCPDDTLELWTEMNTLLKHEFEVKKLEILLELLVDDDVAEKALVGDFATDTNPTTIVKRMISDHAEQHFDDENAAPLLFSTVAAALVERFEYTNLLYYHHCTLVETRINSLNQLDTIRRNMDSAMQAATEADEKNVDILAISKGLKSERETLGPKMMQYVKGIARFLETQLRLVLKAAGLAEVHEYENWDIIETLERQWLQLLDKKVQKLIAKNRSTAAAFESLHIVRKDGSRTEFRWDMVEGIASLADEEPDLDVPIGPMAVFDWVEKHARESVAKWAADGVVAATTATDAFDLSAWSPGVDSEPNPFKPADKSYARIRSLVPARCRIVDASGTGAEETLELMPQRPEFDSDPDGNRPKSASYGTRAGTPSRRAPAGAAKASGARSASGASGGSGGGVNLVTQPNTVGATLTNAERTAHIQALRTCLTHVQGGNGINHETRNDMQLLREQCGTLLQMKSGPEAGRMHRRLVDRYTHVARGGDCANLEEFITRLSNPDQSQKARNRVTYGRESFPADTVEKLRGFGCVGCGGLDHLFVKTDGSQCKHEFCQVQRNWWADVKNRKLTKSVSVEGMPAKSQTYQRFKNVEYTKLYASATRKRGPNQPPYDGKPKHDHFRQGEASIHAINRREGREVGSDASDIPGVSEVAERAKQSPQDVENNRKRMELINERGVYVDPTSAEALCIFAVDIGINELAAREMGLHESGGLDVIGGIGERAPASLARTPSGETVHVDASGHESTLRQLTADVSPVFTPPTSPHGSDEEDEDDGVRLGDDTKTNAPGVATTPASPFPARPADYQPRKPTFSKRRGGIVPTATLTCANNGFQAVGCCDTGAVMCVMNSTTAKKWGLLPYDDVRTATAANGGAMVVHGVANSVEVYMDGHRFTVDFLIADLGGRFDFLLGYDFMRHYRAYPVPETGQLRGYDADGSEFISKSNYSYSRVLDSIEASDDASATATRARIEGVKAQLEHELSDEHGEELHKVTVQCTKALKDATRATHKALCESHNATIMQKMNTDWADERTFMSEVLTADMVCSLDVGVDAARQRMVRTKDELVWANSAVDNFESRKRAASASRRAVETERRNADTINAVGTEHPAPEYTPATWTEHAMNIAGEFGDIVASTADAIGQGFRWARSAVKQTTTSLLQLTL